MSVSGIGNTVSSGLHIAASGLRHAQNRMDMAAHNVASANTAGYLPVQVFAMASWRGGVESLVDLRPVPPFGLVPDGSYPSRSNLVGEMLNLDLAKNIYGANAAVMREQVKADRVLVDTFA